MNKNQMELSQRNFNNEDEYPKYIIKRNGTKVYFDANKIKNALTKGFMATYPDISNFQNTINILCHRICVELSFITKLTVEQCQEYVQIILIKEGFTDVSLKYMNYRFERSVIRNTRGITNIQRKEFSDSVNNSIQKFDSPYSYIVYLRTYARWLGDDFPNDPLKQRRETWEETVDRFIDFMRNKVGSAEMSLNHKEGISEITIQEIRKAILNMEIMPSMRMLQFAGNAVERNNLCAYNCCYVAPTVLEDIVDIMYILMCGTGVGFSVESKFIEQFPIIRVEPNASLKRCSVIETEYSNESNFSRRPLLEYPEKVFIHDSKEGWAEAFRIGLNSWYQGLDVTFNYSKIRPRGARLITSGGIASGPEPLMELLNFAKEKIRGAAGRKLRPIEVHDIICKIGQIVVTGGVRRSAMISLSDLNDHEVRGCKSGTWWEGNIQRSYANNSAVYETTPTVVQLLDEWNNLVKSGSGERGIFNRSVLRDTLPKRRLDVVGDLINEMGTNPCGEIILLSHQLCNLTSVICKYNDTEESLMNKIRLATIVGTFQSKLTSFSYVSKKFQDRAELERLLGVSLAGQCDCEILRRRNSDGSLGNAELYRKLRDFSIQVNKQTAVKIGINESTCITAVKPDGNLGATVGCSSGMKPSHSKYYIRRIRISAADSLAKMLINQGVPANPENGQTIDNVTTYVLSFPIVSKPNSLLREDISAIDMLNFWKTVKINYTEHNPSVTVDVKNNEWINCLEWLRVNWDIVGGLTFFPYSEHTYSQAPYEEISEEEYNNMKSSFPNIDFSELIDYEKVSEVNQKAVGACTGDLCER